MSDIIVDVKIWNKSVGSLIWNKSTDTASFQYEPSFLKRNLNISPLIMPLSGGNKVYEFLQNKNNCFKGLPSLVADSLPDKYGTRIIEEWFLSKGIPLEEISPLDALCYVGKRAMGALEFEPMENLNELNVSSEIHLEELVKLSECIFNDREKFRERLNNTDKSILDILKVGTSAGGAKAKAIIAYNEQTNEVRSGQIKAPSDFGYWLLKFDGTTYEENGKINDNPKGIGNIEYAYYLMAKDCGIDMTECRILQDGEYNHFMTRRFDRDNSGNKIHVQTLAAIANLNRDEKHSYEEIFDVMRRMKLPYVQMEEMFKRMVFNVIARNHDDHTKNHSFLMQQDGTWALSPAYDLCYSYSPNGKWTNKHQMSINGKSSAFYYSDLIAVATNNGIKNPTMIIDNIVDVVSNWTEYGKNAGVNKTHLNEINSNLLLLKKEKNSELEL